MLTEQQSEVPVTKIMEVGALLFGEYRLSSGKHSSFYFDSKPLTLDPEGAYLVGTYFFEKVRNLGAKAVGGLEVGALPIVEAVTLISHINNHPLPGFFVRKGPKTYGTEKLIEGNLPRDKTCSVVIIDDVVTGGRSILRAIEAVEAVGNPIAGIMCILDRDEGGREMLNRRGYDLQAMYTAVKNERGNGVDIIPNP